MVKSKSLRVLILRPTFLEKFLHQQKQWNDGKDSCTIVTKMFLSNFTESMESELSFEWNIFPGLTSLELLRKIQEYLGSRNIDPQGAHW